MTWSESCFQTFDCQLQECSARELPSSEAAGRQGVRQREGACLGVPACSHALLLPERRRQQSSTPQGSRGSAEDQQLHLPDQQRVHAVCQIVRLFDGMIRNYVLYHTTMYRIIHSMMVRYMHDDRKPNLGLQLHCAHIQVCKSLGKTPWLVKSSAQRRRGI